jgi:3-deoxy-D-manno-octulosonate 8-phosphate phosphatase (KDO 8-P phosphatase)
MLLEDIKVFIFDFDGVLTNNIVYIDQDGKESVSCSRSDGLAFDVLRKINKPTYILSTEENKVVTARANKLKVPVFQGVEDKAKAIKSLADSKAFDLDSVLYVGNDLNDYNAMKLCKYTSCPSDSHKIIKSISTYVLKTPGGGGVVRELLEGVFKLNFIEILYSKGEH